MPTRLLLALVALALAAGCGAVASATRPVTRAVGGVLLSPEDEKRLGDQLAAEVKKQERVLEDAQVVQYVERVGQQVLSAVPARERKGTTFSFTVLEQPDVVNAFALPGGHIFVASGLLKAVGSEAELAGVLAHEIAHVTRGHVSERLAAAVGLQTLQALAVGAAPGVLTELASTIVATGYLAAYSRGQETEADTTGLPVLARAGYTPGAMPAFFRTLAKAEGRGGRNPVAAFVASHPDPGARAERLQQEIARARLEGGRPSLVGDLAAVQARLPGGSPVAGRQAGPGERPHAARRSSPRWARSTRRRKPCTSRRQSAGWRTSM